MGAVGVGGAVAGVVAVVVAGGGVVVVVVAGGIAGAGGVDLTKLKRRRQT